MTFGGTYRKADDPRVYTCAYVQGDQAVLRSVGVSIRDHALHWHRWAQVVPDAPETVTAGEWVAR